MSRLGGTDDPAALVPGRPDNVLAVVDQCVVRATCAGAAADVIRPRRSIDDWTGEAADAYAERADAVMKRWSSIADSLDEVTAPLRAYAQTLRDAQRLAEKAIDAWSYAQSLSTDTSHSDVWVFPQAPWPVSPFDARHGGDVPSLRPHGESRAQAMLADARADVIAAGDAAATVVERVAGEVAAQGSVWAAVGKTLGSPVVANTRLLALLSGLDGAALAAVLPARPDLLARLRTVRADQIAPFWRDLDDDQRRTLIDLDPSLIGSLGGVAYRDRDRANRLVLAQAIADAEASLPDSAEQLGALRALEQASKGNTLASLVLDVPPLAQVAVGDLDEADNVSVLVPGMNSTVEGDVKSYVHAARDFQLAQRSVSDDSSLSFATLVWLGYHPPSDDDVVSVWGDERALVGARALVSDLRAFDAVRESSGTDPVLTVIAHSYGTNVATLALQTSPADHVVLFDSAGVSSEVSDAAELLVPAGEVFATEAVDDGWAHIGREFSGRRDPTSPEFGAEPFSSEEAVIDGKTYEKVGKHGPFGDGAGKSSYLDANASANRYAAMISVGRGDEVPRFGSPMDRDDIRRGQFMAKFS